MPLDDKHAEVLPGFTRADLRYTAECLEGDHGQARVVEEAPKAAAFIRAAMAMTARDPQTLNAIRGGVPRLLQGEGKIPPQAGAMLGGDALTPYGEEVARAAPPLAASASTPAPELTPEEWAEIRKQRERAERNRGDADSEG